MHHGDDHRVGAGIVLGVTTSVLPGTAPAHLSSPANVGWLAANGAETVTPVPTQLRPCLGHDPRVGAAHVLGGGPGVLKGQAVPLEALAFDGRDIRHEVRHSIQQAEEYQLRLHIQPAQFFRAHPGQLVLSRNRHIQLPHGQHTARRVSGLGGQPLLVPALHLSPVQRVACEDMRNSLASFVHSLFRSDIVALFYNMKRTDFSATANPFRRHQLGNEWMAV